MMIDELPMLTNRYEVRPEQMAAFRRDGHLLLRGVASPFEAASYRGVITDAAMRQNSEVRPLAERDTYGKAFLQIMNLWRHDPAVARFVLSARFAGVATALLGAERVRLYHDQALFKEPGGGHTPWHQDAVYWPIDGTRCVTMWMPLVDITPEMGGVSFASGTNTAGALGEAVISDESDQHFDALVRDRGIIIQRPVAMAAGDATFHGGWTLHNAEQNHSSAVREVMTVIFFADGIEVSEPANESQRRDMGTWLPGLRPGDRAASTLNPLLPYPV